MRPASEIHSALDLLDAELERQTGDPAWLHMSIARDVLAWAVGGHAPLDTSNAWLAAFLLDDPEQIGPPPGDN